ncbi:MAG: HEAT repeat domain-containing protein [Roseiflexaceae bacterium]
MHDTNDPLAELCAEAADPRTSLQRLRELAQDPRLAPIVASNSAVDADLLSELTDRGENSPLVATLIGLPVARTNPHKIFDSSDATLAAVAANPNTPVETLMRLAGVFPEQFCANPALPLLLLENPNLPAEMPPATLRSLLRYASVPKDFLEWVVAYGSPALAAEARLHIHLGAATGPDSEKQARAAMRHMTISKLIDIVPITMTTDLLVEMLVLGAVPAWLMEILAESDDALIQQAISAGVRTAAPAASVAGAEIRTNTDDLDPARIRQLGEDDDPQVRARAARSLAMPLDLLAWLAEDESRIVRRAVAENPNATARILDVLAQDYSWSNEPVRLAVVRHPNISTDTIERLASDRSACVRQAVLAHPDAPTQARERILVAALEHCQMLSEPIYQTIALGHPLTPAAKLMAGVRSLEWMERYALARNPAAPDEALVALAQDGNRLVRAAARERVTR